VPAHVTSGLSRAPLSAAMPPARGGKDSADDSTLDTDWERRARNRTPSARWIGWRLRGLVLSALIGCVAMFALIRVVAQQPVLEQRLAIDDRGMLRLAGPTPEPHVTHLLDAAGQAQPIDRLLMQRSARWLVSDADRQRQWQQHDLLAAALERGQVRFIDSTGQTLEVATMPRGANGLGWVFWLLSTLALLLYLVTMVVVLARPGQRNILYAVLALMQCGNLLFLAIVSTPGIGAPAGFMRWEHDARTLFDLVTAGALVHSANLHPRRLPNWPHRVAIAWALVVAALLLSVVMRVPSSWWLTQGALILAGALAIAQLLWMQRRDPHPLAVQLVRFSALALATLVLLTVTVATISPALDPRGQAPSLGATVWVGFLSVMLIMLPFMSRTQQLMREFSLVAGVSTVATALDLLFVAVFSLGSFASLTLATFISLAVYAGARQWLVSQLIARKRVSTERMFEHIYRMAREVQLQPQSAGEQMRRLVRELFDPIEARMAVRSTRRSQVLSDGTQLVVPVPPIGPRSEQGPGAVVLGFAERGRRLFTDEDARLTDRVVDLIVRAVAFDQAVEHGRIEERARIAQDLHDDIGARLLTLMYKAPTPEMEDYVRHTLKDLKTLTRGLAAPNHPLSHAAAEWKADIAQRVSAAGGELVWAFSCDRDFELSVVQWSALTRVLRELVSNALAHAQAERVHIDIRLERGNLALVVGDDGNGRKPENWSHGLGLGGVRKRVKQLGGDVAWRENEPRGIVCRVFVPGLASAAWRPA
jgi:signal transduction histidine kinase